MRTDGRACITNPKVFVTVLLIFLAGAFVGALAMRLGGYRIAEARPLYWQESGKQVSLERLNSELNLTPVQREELETVLDDFVMYMQTLQAQMEDVRANGKARVMRVLDEEQRKKFERLLDGLQQARR